MGEEFNLQIREIEVILPISKIKISAIPTQDIKKSVRLLKENLCDKKDNGLTCQNNKYRDEPCYICLKIDKIFGLKD